VGTGEGVPVKIRNKKIRNRFCVQMDLCASLIPKPTPPGYLFLKGLCACEDDGLMDEFAMENAGPGGTHSPPAPENVMRRT